VGQDGGPVPEVELSVVMPAHNEEDLLDKAVHAVVDGLRHRDRAFEVVVVENGSVDRTAVIAAALADEIPEVTAISSPAPDYGLALRTGFLAARGQVVVNFDVDYTDLAFLDAAVAEVVAPGGPVIVVGSKRGAGAVDERALPRRLVTAVFSSILRYGFGLKVSDTHGMKALRREPLLPVVQSCRFGTDLFDTELVLRAERAGLPTSELPVLVEELRPSRTPIARRIPRTVSGLVRLRLALWRERA
jgi:glycosyltransferase involved in cell wall biosynthesis